MQMDQGWLGHCFSSGLGFEVLAQSSAVYSLSGLNQFLSGFDCLLNKALLLL